MKSVNHRNKTGRLRLDAVPHFWDWIKGNSSFGSTANVSFKVDVNTLSLKKKNLKRSENRVLEMDASVKNTERNLFDTYVCASNAAC